MMAETEFFELDNKKYSERVPSSWNSIVFPYAEFFKVTHYIPHFNEFQ